MNTILMQIAEIPGSVTTKGYENWIALQHAELPYVGKQVHTQLGSYANRVSGNPFFSEFHIVKSVDKSSIKLFEYAHNSVAIPEITIAYCSMNSGSQSVDQHKSYLLKNVLISRFTDSHPLEYLSLNFSSIEKTIIPMQGNSTRESPLRTGYDLQKAAKA